MKFTLRIENDFYEKLKNKNLWNSKYLNKLLSKQLLKENNVIDKLISKYNEWNLNNINSYSIEELEQLKLELKNDKKSIDDFLKSHKHEKKFKKTIYINNKNNLSSKDINNILNLW